MVSRSYYSNFRAINDKFLPQWGEGETMASQIVTAINNLVYKWYNDGDVYDNTYYLKGWCNNLSSYANWLLNYVDATMLLKIEDTTTDSDYEDILKELTDFFFDEELLNGYNTKEKVGSIYDCDGPFEFFE